MGRPAKCVEMRAKKFGIVCVLPTWLDGFTEFEACISCRMSLRLSLAELIRGVGLPAALCRAEVALCAEVQLNLDDLCANPSLLMRDIGEESCSTRAANKAVPLHAVCDCGPLCILAVGSPVQCPN